MDAAGAHDRHLVHPRDGHRLHLDNAADTDHFRAHRRELGYDPIAFAIIGILAIEAGLLTPPFGLLVYTVKAAIRDEDESISIMEIFRSSMPYWIIMLVGLIAIVNFPQIATYLPSLVF